MCYDGISAVGITNHNFFVTSTGLNWRFSSLIGVCDGCCIHGCKICKITPWVPVVHGMFGSLCALSLLIHVTIDGGHFIVYNVLFCTFICDARTPSEVSLFNCSQESCHGHGKRRWHDRTNGVGVFLHNYVYWSCWHCDHCVGGIVFCFETVGEQFPWQQLMVHARDSSLGLSTLARQ